MPTGAFKRHHSAGRVCQPQTGSWGRLGGARSAYGHNGGRRDGLEAAVERRPGRFFRGHCQPRIRHGDVAAGLRCVPPTARAVLTVL